jgi:hypothetical protein
MDFADVNKRLASTTLESVLPSSIVCGGRSRETIEDSKSGVGQHQAYGSNRGSVVDGCEMGGLAEVCESSLGHDAEETVLLESVSASESSTSTVETVIESMSVSDSQNDTDMMTDLATDQDGSQSEPSRSRSDDTSSNSRTSRKRRLSETEDSDAEEDDLLPEIKKKFPAKFASLGSGSKLPTLVSSASRPQGYASGGDETVIRTRDVLVAFAPGQVAVNYFTATDCARDRPRYILALLYKLQKLFLFFYIFFHL